MIRPRPLLAVALLLAGLVAAQAAPPSPQPLPPVTGSMYNGNNLQAPRLEPPQPPASVAVGRSNDPAQAATGAGAAGTGGGSISAAGGGN